MSVSGSLSIFSLVMAVLTGVHGVVEIIPDRLLERIPFGQIVMLISRMAVDTAQPLCLMSIRFSLPLLSPFPFLKCRMAGPAVFIRRFPHDLEMKVLKIGHLHTINRQITRFIL